MPSPPRVSRTELFWGFLTVSLSGFGGVMPFARRMLVERRRWLTEREFLDLLGLCQFLPGPNIVNMSICVGSRFQGGAGAAIACGGLLIAPFCLVLALGALYSRFGELTAVRGALGGLGAAAAGLVVSTGLRMLWPYRRSGHAMAFAAMTFVAVALLRWPLHWVLLVLAPLSIAVAWRRP